MKITIGRDALLDALAPAAKVAAKSRTKDLACVLLDAGEAVSFEATDLTESVRCEAAAMVDEPGQALLPGRLLSDIARSLPDGAVTIEADGASASLRCGKSSFKLPALSARTFPRFSADKPTGTLKAKGRELADVARRASAFVSASTDRADLKGVSFEWSDGSAKVCATDSYFGIELTFEAKTEGSASAIIPAGLVQAVASCKSDAEASLSVGASKATFECDGTAMSSRLIDATFPPMSRILATEFQTEASFEREALLASVERAQAVGAGKTAVLLDVSESETLISVDGGEEGSMAEPVGCEATGQASFAVFPHLMKAALKNSVDEGFRLGLGGPRSPIMALSKGCRIFAMPKVRR